MYNVRLAAERGSGTGWVLYDEPYRLRKVRSPFSLWGEVVMELWLLYIVTQDRTFPNLNTNSSAGPKNSTHDLQLYSLILLFVSMKLKNR